jgi:protein-disulfide isomerase
MGLFSSRVSRLAVLLAPGLLLILSGCAAQGPPGPSTDAEQSPADTSTDSAQRTAYKMLGRSDAPIAIMEFTDLQCPYCARFALQTLPALRERYVDKGLVKFASHDLPLPRHAYAIPSAIAARCAGEQGHYWEYREALFRGQAQLATAPYDNLAEHFGLDVARFAACRADGRHALLLRQDAELAAAQGISVTPSFVIVRVVDGKFVGEIITGAQPLEVFEQRLQALVQEVQ